MYYDVRIYLLKGVQEAGDVGGIRETDEIRSNLSRWEKGKGGWEWVRGRGGGTYLLIPTQRGEGEG